MPQYGAESARAAPIGSTVPRTTAPMPSILIIFFTAGSSREAPWAPVAPVYGDDAGIQPWVVNDVPRLAARNARTGRCRLACRGLRRPGAAAARGGHGHAQVEHAHQAECGGVVRCPRGARQLAAALRAGGRPRRGRLPRQRGCRREQPRLGPGDRRRGRRPACPPRFNWTAAEPSGSGLSVGGHQGVANYGKEVAPALDDLAIGDSVDDQFLGTDLPAGGGDAAEGSGVRPPTDESGGDPVLLDHQLLQLPV